MKFLEGKSPAERNKIIAALILGGVAFIALSYTLSGFLFPSKANPTTTTTKTPTPTPAVARTSGEMTISPEDIALLTTPISYSPISFSSDAGRNVFAFYEPPAPTPYSPTPYIAKPIPTPTPPPPPPIMLGYVSPSNIYAGSKTFRMEVAGDKFTAESIILFNGSELPTNFINTQKLTADVPAVLIASDGAKTVMVRTPDGKLFSNQMILQVQPPPVPNFEYIGLVEKKHRNNDMAILREKGKTEVAGFRLNDTIGERFRLISISGREVILEDRSLGFKHRLPFIEGKATGGGSTGAGPGVISNGFRDGRGTGLPNQFPAFPSNPNPTNPTNEIAPGIPGNVPRQQPNSNRPQQPNPNKKDYEDDNDDGDNR
jgi:hypothetical protein